MKKSIFLASALAAALTPAGSVRAASETGNLVPMRVETKQQAEVKNQNQEQEIEMENEQRTQSGSDSGTQLRLEDRERLRGDTGTGTPEQEQKRESEDNDAMDNAEQRRSQVANAVQAMLQVADRNGGIGEQVRVIAQEQNQNQEQLEAGLEKVKERGGFAKFFIGPNYGEIDKAAKMLEQNRERVEELNRIAEKLANAGDKQQLMEQIQTLERANLQVQNDLAVSQKGFSLFGWVFRLFAK